MEGQVYGKLTVLCQTPERKRGSIVWECLCECGNICYRTTDAIKRHTKSCGCLKREKAIELGKARVKSVGGIPTDKHPLYPTWRSMRTRCYYEGHEGYPNYGGRGITVCDRWLESFAAFVEDMGERPEGHTLDRIDNDGNYSPDNCRWATRKEQALNRR